MKADLNDLFGDAKTIFWDDDHLHNFLYSRLQRIFEDIDTGLYEMRVKPETMTIFIMSILYNHFENTFSFMDMMEDCTELNERFLEEELNGKVSLDEIFDYGKAFGSNEPTLENEEDL